MARDLKFSAYKREVGKRLRNLSDEEAKILYNSQDKKEMQIVAKVLGGCLLYTSPSPRDGLLSRMPSSA